jgi:uncharacterized protein YuzE
MAKGMVPHMAHRDYDAEADATYYVVSDGTFHHTVHVTDLIMVNVDERGKVIGVEFAFNDEDASQGELDALFSAYPQLRKELPMGFRQSRPADANELATSIVASATERDAITASVASGPALRIIDDGDWVITGSRILSAIPVSDDAELLVS